MTDTELRDKTPTEALEFLREKKFKGISAHDIFTFVVKSLTNLPENAATVSNMPHTDAEAYSALTRVFYGEKEDIRPMEWESLFLVSSTLYPLAADATVRENLLQVNGMAIKMIQEAGGNS